MSTAKWQNIAGSKKFFILYLNFCLNFFQSKTSPTFIEHVVQIHPRARHVIEDLINLKRHQIDTKAVGSELPDHSSILEDVEDYINYDLSREGSDYVPSSEDENVNDENIESGKVNSSPKAASKKVVKTEAIDEENDTKGQEI